jgi:hypothetical protein
MKADYRLEYKAWLNNLTDSERKAETSRFKTSLRLARKTAGIKPKPAKTVS